MNFEKIKEAIAQQTKDLAQMFTDVAEYEKMKRDENFKILNDKIDTKINEHKQNVKKGMQDFIKAVC